MLAVQKYLEDNSIESLSKYGIGAKYHPTLPYVILDYDMIESSNHKTNPIIKECRGIVLNTQDFSVVQKAFNRFYNLGESECTENFDWKNFMCKEKLDGSLIKVRWYNNELLITTRNSFADTECGDSGKSWKELVTSCLTQYQLDVIKDNSDFTFVFEFMSPYNHIVVQHHSPWLSLLTLTNKNGCSAIIHYVELSAYFSTPNKYEFTSIEEIEAFLEQLEKDQNPMEGFVLTDSNGLMLKIKSKFYLKLHRLNNNGCITNIKNIVPIILAGEIAEVLLYFPHLQPRIAEVQLLLGKLATELHDAWVDCKNIEDQKEFAIRITKTRYTPFSSILFKMKRAGKIHNAEELGIEFCNADSLILKILDQENVK
jgi:hypothetical protein